MGTNLLSARLKELEVAGLIEKQSSEVKREPYRLTPKGREIEPIALEFIRWGYRYGIGNEGFSHWDHWELLAMKAFFNPNKAESLLVAQFRCQALTAWVQVGPAGFCHGMGERDDANLVIASTITDFQKNYQMGKYESSAIAKSFASCFDLPQSEVHR